MSSEEPSHHEPQRGAPADHPIIDSHGTACCIVGGGPAGLVLAYLLARRGIAATLLEAHNDFDREFRGDTLHPSILEVLDSLGLADRLLALPHTKVGKITMRVGASSYAMADFSGLKTRFPYIALIPQEKFLDFMAPEARKFPSFRLVMGANVKELIEQDGSVRGVRYQSHEGWHEVRAVLTVAADGRFSRLRALAKLEPVRTSPPMDVLWFRLPRRQTDPEESGAGFHVGHGRILVALPRPDHWQIGYVIPKGGYHEIKARGIEALRTSIAASLPLLADRVDTITDWSQISPLTVESNRLRRWYCPGLLLIGDAAHVMSPVGGVGINYAFQDAVVAANVLAEPLGRGRVELSDLARVQRERELPTRVIQAFQSLVQKRVLRPALADQGDFKPPLFFRIPLIRNLVVRLIAFGLRRVHVED